jgi:hypothetical protein
MADVQFYESDNEARLWDRGVVITLTAKHPKKLTRRSVRSVLRRFGYVLNNWTEADWGCEAKATRRLRK